MMKRVFPFILALLMLCTLVACSGDEDDGLMNDAVINVGIQVPTYKDSDGDTFTYEYLTSTTVAITGFTGNDEPHTVTIPAEIEGRAVTEIADEAFYAKSNIAAIQCEAKLTRIGDYAFAYCEALLTVDIPETVETVGKGAFYNCTSLTTCELSEGVVSVGDQAFAGCVALTTVSFPKTLTAIGQYAFANCTALSAISLPEGVASVGAQAFYNCTAVETLSLPATLTEIGDWAFNPIVRDLADEAITVPAGSVAEEHIKQFR